MEKEYITYCSARKHNDSSIGHSYAKCFTAPLTALHAEAHAILFVIIFPNLEQLPVRRVERNDSTHTRCLPDCKPSAIRAPPQASRVADRACDLEADLDLPLPARA